MGTDADGRFRPLRPGRRSATIRRLVGARGLVDADRTNARLRELIAIVLGGGLSLIGEPLRERVARALPGFVTRAFQSTRPTVRLARLGEDVVAVGALLLAAS